MTVGRSLSEVAIQGAAVKVDVERYSITIDLYAVAALRANDVPLQSDGLVVFRIAYRLLQRVPAAHQNPVRREATQCACAQCQVRTLCPRVSKETT